MSPSASAGDPLLGALIGGGIGAAIGHGVNGRNGAWVGGTLGAVTGASMAANSSGSAGGHRWRRLQRRRLLRPVRRLRGPGAGVLRDSGAVLTRRFRCIAPPVVYRPRPVYAPVRLPHYPAHGGWNGGDDGRYNGGYDGGSHGSGGAGYGGSGHGASGDNGSRHDGSGRGSANGYGGPRGYDGNRYDR